MVTGQALATLINDLKKCSIDEDLSVGVRGAFSALHLAFAAIPTISESEEVDHFAAMPQATAKPTENILTEEQYFGIANQIIDVHQKLAQATSDKGLRGNDTKVFVGITKALFPSPATAVENAHLQETAVRRR